MECFEGGEVYPGAGGGKQRVPARPDRICMWQTVWRYPISRYANSGLTEGPDLDLHLCYKFEAYFAQLKLPITTDNKCAVSANEKCQKCPLSDR